MAFDVAAVLDRIFSGGRFTPATGTITQGGTSYALASASMFGVVREIGGGDRDRETAQLVVLADDMGATPQRDATFTLTGDTDPWLVLGVETIGPPAGSAAAWTLRIVRDVAKES